MKMLLAAVLALTLVSPALADPDYETSFILLAHSRYPACVHHIELSATQAGHSDDLGQSDYVNAAVWASLCVQQMLPDDITPEVVAIPRHYLASVCEILQLEYKVDLAACDHWYAKQP